MRKGAHTESKIRLNEKHDKVSSFLDKNLYINQNKNKSSRFQIKIKMT